MRAPGCIASYAPPERFFLQASAQKYALSLESPTVDECLPMTDRDLFIAALQKPNAADRKAYLDESCRGDAQLRQEVEALLREHAQLGSFLEAPVLPGSAELQELHAKAAESPGLPVYAYQEPPREGPGSFLGPYKLLEQIGEGGFGLVFMAEQRQPVRRKVAIKILKPGMDTRQIIARFEAERQALALMDHPNIAKILDAGETSTGRPYFVMELCRGVPITEFCDENALTTRERLELFVSVCHSVQHAHQKGLIHRDIKPSNVLITLHDAAPMVKMIDFGIAKALGQQLTDKTLFTGFAQLLGTPLYMSPEQASMSDQDIDTRSDIYSLGVLLYELLTGLTPFDKDRLRDAGLDLRRIIREEEPPKPSTRLSTVGKASTTISARRKSDPKKLCQLFRGELDWIVMKSLEKDRSRRYQSAGAFAADVQAYLLDEPVHACPPSVAYRLRKFARRHRTMLQSGLAASLFLLLAAGAIGWSVRDRAARRSATAQSIDDSLYQATECMKQRRWQDAQVLVRRAEDLLGEGGDQARQAHVGQLIADLAMVARLDELRLHVKSLKESNEDPGPTDPDYASAFRGYGIDIESLDAHEAAERVAERAIFLELALALDNWAVGLKAAQPRERQRWMRLLTIARLADPDPWRQNLRLALENGNLNSLQDLARSALPVNLPVVSLVHLASALRAAGALPDALAILNQAQGYYPADFWLNHELAYCLEASRPPQLWDALRYFTVAAALRPQSARLQLALSRVHRQLGRYDDAVAACERATRLQPGFGGAYINLAIERQTKGSIDAAIRAIQENYLPPSPNLAAIVSRPRNAQIGKREVEAVIDAHRRAIALQSDDANAYYNLGVTLENLGRIDEAIPLYEKTLQLYPQYAAAHYNLGRIFRQRNQSAAALLHLEKAVRLQPGNVKAHIALGSAYRANEQEEEATVSYRKAIDVDPTNASAHYHLGLSLRAQQRLDEAAAAYRDALRCDPRDTWSMVNLGHLLVEQLQINAGIDLYRRAIDVGPAGPAAHIGLGAALMKKGRTNDAIAVYQQAIRFWPTKAMAHYNLGNALLVIERWEEALAAFEEAIRLQPHYPEAYCNRGKALWHLGRMADALASYRQGHELRPVDSKSWPYPSDRWITEAERLVRLDELLPAVQDGTAVPASPDEWAEFANLCFMKGLPDLSLQYFSRAFSSKPQLESDARLGHRYRAACMAALVSAPAEETSSRSTEDQRSLRDRAGEWLRAELKARRQQSVNASPAQALAVERVLQQWLEQPALAGLRDAERLARLPEPEQRAWKTFWSDVRALLKEAAGTSNIQD